MAGVGQVLEDGSVLSRIDQQLHKLESTLALVSGLAIFSLMLLAVVSVAGRHFFNMPLPGYVDWIEQAMPLIAFMGIAYTQRNGGHIRMDMLVAQLNGRALWLFEWLTSLCVLALICLLIWGSWSHFSRSFDFASPWWSRDSSMDISLPLWPAKLMVPLAFSVLALRMVIQLWGFGVAFVTNATVPVAVPLVLDAATQAAAESQYILADEEVQRP
ncbi:TRAP transporter small permease [Candidatus Njordibacter sp. Uisw_056]|jgi:TRAP-type C4-dicarboxylate transport system permease small subunit|uniref:TRAP transporter small permease subunit n=1 Tax=Candidatus Njordibacter sp. Uisw_056 TaxID=3230973 RepID=UPI003D397583|tara:strand:- start:99 stop:743 length:645 start_codon:yes stop_codon:yes gene_type:complete